MLFGASSEKTENVLKKPETRRPKTGEKKKVKGHGRNGAADYIGAEMSLSTYHSIFLLAMSIT